MITFTHILYLLFGLAAVSGIIAVWLFITQARFSGLVSLLVGVAIAALSLFMWHNFQGFGDQGVALQEARQTIRLNTDEISDLKASLRKAEADLLSSRRANTLDGAGARDLANQLRQAKDKLVIANERARTEILRADRSERRLDDTQKELRDLTGELATERSLKADITQKTAHQLDLLLERARKSRVDVGRPIGVRDMPGGVTASENQKRFDLLDQEIRRLGDALPATALAEELRDLKERMAYGYSTDDYNVEVFPDNEMIKGKKGSYYVIDLKDAEGGAKFGFAAGKYTLDRSDKKFRKALSVFMRDVAEKLEGNIDYQLMVRGSADAAAYRGLQNKDYQYREISYLPEVGEGRYLTTETVRQVEVKIVNEDLPFLRAKYLKELVGDVYPTSVANILEGQITSKVNKRDRNAELLLFVNWD